MENSTRFGSLLIEKFSLSTIVAMIISINWIILLDVPTLLTTLSTTVPITFKIIEMIFAIFAILFAIVFRAVDAIAVIKQQQQLDNGFLMLSAVLQQKQGVLGNLRVTLCLNKRYSWIFLRICEF